MNNSIAKWTVLKVHESKAETKHKDWPCLVYLFCFLVGIVAVGREMIDFANHHPRPIVTIVMGLVWLDIRDM
ncbi:hypothetical protein ACVJGD_004357 [Bradyrhizobium sp. USDA 10063]